MAKYRIGNRVSGADLGVYEGETAAAAIEAMDRDAGYASSADAAESLGTTVEAMRAELVVVEETA